MAKQYTHEDILRQIQTLVAASSEVEVAARLGVSRTFLRDVRAGRREVSVRLARALGYNRKVVFSKEPQAA